MVQRSNSKLIFGTGLSSCKDFEGLCKVCKTALSEHIVMFDTAPSYRTEAVLSKAVAKSANELGLNRDDYWIQTKIDPIQMFNGNIEDYFKEKLAEMQLEYVDSLLIHWPVLNYIERTWISMKRLQEDGYVKNIGICNLRLLQLEEFKQMGIEPETLQIERHPLNTFNDEVKYCQEHNINLQDYSPLCKMHPLISDNEKIKVIADKHECNIGQLILKWHISTGATPVFTSTKPSRIMEYAHLEKISLSKDEISQIASLNCNHKLYLESLVCPGF